ncbi:MAG: 6-phosphogluconolactonase, partial [Actinomycetota bacterium]|nr:6-phosphogluconolactonase [Actinomycetota bacterium]
AAELVGEAAARGGHVGLSGGSTPGPAYEAAAGLAPDWSRAGLWWVDERCVPPDDERSNYRLVRRTLLDRLELLPAVHRIRGELSAERAAAEYERELRGVRLDLVLLGVGADGHTASLFPNDPALREGARRAVAVARADIDRVTLTVPFLRTSATVVFLAVGADKAEAVGRAFGAEGDAATPASLIRSEHGRTIALLDRAAAANLPA